MSDMPCPQSPPPTMHHPAPTSWSRTHAVTTSGMRLRASPPSPPPSHASQAYLPPHRKQGALRAPPQEQVLVRRPRLSNYAAPRGALAPRGTRHLRRASSTPPAPAQPAASQQPPGTPAAERRRRAPCRRQQRQDSTFRQAVIPGLPASSNGFGPSHRWCQHPPEDVGKELLHARRLQARRFDRHRQLLRIQLACATRGAEPAGTWLPSATRSYCSAAGPSCYVKAMG